MAFLRIFVFFILLPFCLFARHYPYQPSPVPETIPPILQNFAYAPWWTGSLLSAPGNCLDPGLVNLQPYVSYVYSAKNYLTHGKTERVSAKNAIDFLLFAQAGIVKNMDASLILEQFSCWTNHHSASVFGDAIVTVGFQLLRETEHLPNIRFVVREKFPTGKYQHLNAKMNLFDGYTGSGCFTSGVTLDISKVAHWFYHHPIAWRLNLYQFFPNNKAHVHGFNSYGGGYGTNGKVKPPKTFWGIFSFEYSFTQRWAYAMDFWYSRNTRYRFSGNPGVTSSGEIASNSSRYSQILAITPSIEYNLNPNQGFIGGIFFTVLGRNATKFFNTVLSYEVTF